MPAVDRDGNPCERYTGSAQRFAPHELAGESQATVGAWADALKDKGRDVLNDGTLSSPEPAIVLIRFWIWAHRQKRDLAREVNARMGDFRRDQERPAGLRKIDDFTPKGGW